MLRAKFASLPVISAPNKRKCDADAELELLRDGFIVLIHDFACLDPLKQCPGTAGRRRRNSNEEG
jgi:hypothetical protein